MKLFFWCGQPVPFWVSVSWSHVFEHVWKSCAGRIFVGIGRLLHFKRPVVTQTHRIARTVIKPQPAKQSLIKLRRSTPTEFIDLYFRHTAMCLYISRPTPHATFIHDTSVTKINMTTGWKVFHSASVPFFVLTRSNYEKKNLSKASFNNKYNDRGTCDKKS